MTNDRKSQRLEIEQMPVAFAMAEFIQYFAKAVKSVGKKYMVIMANRVYSTNEFTNGSSKFTGNFLGDLDYQIFIPSNRNDMDMYFNQISKEVAIWYGMFMKYYREIFVDSVYVIDVEEFLEMYKRWKSKKLLKSLASVEFSKDVEQNGEIFARYNRIDFYLQRPSIVETTSTDSDYCTYTYGKGILKNQAPKLVHDGRKSVHKYLDTNNSITIRYKDVNVENPLVYTTDMKISEIESKVSLGRIFHLRVANEYANAGTIAISKNLIPKVFTKDSDMVDDAKAVISVYHNDIIGGNVYFLAIERWIIPYVLRLVIDTVCFIVSDEPKK